MVSIPAASTLGRREGPESLRWRRSSQRWKGEGDGWPGNTYGASSALSSVPLPHRRAVFCRLRCWELGSAARGPLDWHSWSHIGRGSSRSPSRLSPSHSIGPTGRSRRNHVHHTAHAELRLHGQRLTLRCGRFPHFFCCCLSFRSLSNICRLVSCLWAAHPLAKRQVLWNRVVGFPPAASRLVSRISRGTNRQCRSSRHVKSCSRFRTCNAPRSRAWAAARCWRRSWRGLIKLKVFPTASRTGPAQSCVFQPHPAPGATPWP